MGFECGSNDAIVAFNPRNIPGEPLVNSAPAFLLGVGEGVRLGAHQASSEASCVCKTRAKL